MQEQMCFRDADAPWIAQLDSQPDSTFSQGGYGDASLGSWLERPVKIATFTWAVGTGIADQMDPWTLFLTHPSVAKRIDNFAFLRCKMHIKVMINGTAFHYGKAMLSYQPLAALDGTTNLGIFHTNYASLQIRSQRPKIFIDAGTSQGGELVLPFINLNNWINVTDAASISNMGLLTIQDLEILKHANDGVTNVNISVFAWASDVELCMPTSSLSAQSDEYDEGIVSKPASAVAKAAGMLSNVPLIGPYAMATKLAASAVSAVAKLFGFSRPTIITDIALMKPVFGGNIANCDAAETCSKLTIDSKQELTIDPRTVGLTDVDELSILYIAQKESIITKFPWTIAAAANTLLWTANVTPMLNLQAAYTPMYLSGLTFATLPFYSWSGSIIYRFQIIASQFHRGRLRIAWDPVSDNVAVTADTFNTVYSRIIDLATDRDFEFEVSWGSFEAYLDTRKSTTDVFQVNNFAPTNAACTALDVELHNGRLAIWVLNELTAPVDTADISIVVSVKAGDDFTLRNPLDANMTRLTVFEPQSDVFDLQAEVSTPVEDENIPEGTGAPELIVGEEFKLVGKRDLVFFGESIDSFRTLLRRYNFYQTYFAPSAPAAGAELVGWNTKTKNFPKYFGFDPNGADVVAGDPFNINAVTLLNYLTPAYTCRRGGLRWKYLACPGNARNNALVVSRYAQISAFGTDVAELVNTGAGDVFNRVSLLVQRSNITSLGGSYMTPTQNQPCAEVELPFYTKRRFALARNLDFNTGLAIDSGNRRNHAVVLTTTLDAIMAMDSWVSVGEDFSLYGYMGPPVMWTIAALVPG